MKINIIKWVNVLEVAKNDKTMLTAFLKFHEKLKVAKWNSPNDILKTFNSADILNCQLGNRVIFNIGGNKYRMICGYHFSESYVFLFVKFVGSHSDYDQVDPCTIEMFKT